MSRPKHLNFRNNWTGEAFPMHAQSEVILLPLLGCQIPMRIQAPGITRRQQKPARPVGFGQSVLRDSSLGWLVGRGRKSADGSGARGSFVLVAFQKNGRKHGPFNPRFRLLLG